MDYNIIYFDQRSCFYLFADHSPAHLAGAAAGLRLCAPMEALLTLPQTARTPLPHPREFGSWLCCCVVFRSIMKTDSAYFEMPTVRRTSVSGRDSLPGYDDAIGYRRGGGGALTAAPPPSQRSSHLQPSSSMEKKRKTVRLSDSHQYYSDYNNDTDDW